MADKTNGRYAYHMYSMWAIGFGRSFITLGAKRGTTQYDGRTVLAHQQASSHVQKV